MHNKEEFNKTVLLIQSKIKEKFGYFIYYSSVLNALNKQLGVENILECLDVLESEYQNDSEFPENLYYFYMKMIGGKSELLCIKSEFSIRINESKLREILSRYFKTEIENIEFLEDKTIELKTK